MRNENDTSNDPSADNSPISNLSASSNSTFIDGSAAGDVLIPNGTFLLEADYSRVGSDLVLETPNGQSIIVGDYFAQSHAATLVNEAGAQIRGTVADKLAGPEFPAQYAQTGAGTLNEAIGSIDQATGEITVTSVDGAVRLVSSGDPIFQGDVIVTGADGALGIIFIDKSTMSMSENGRIVLDELIYNPDTYLGSQVFEIVQGAFVFTSGIIGKNAPEDVIVNTPVATIGIRGTKYAVDVSELGGETTVVLLEGAISITNNAGEVLIDVVGFFTFIAGINILPTSPILMPADQLESLMGRALLFHPPLQSILPEELIDSQQGALDDIAEALENLETAAGGNPPVPVSNGGLFSVQTGSLFQSVSLSSTLLGSQSVFGENTSNAGVFSNTQLLVTTSITTTLPPSSIPGFIGGSGNDILNGTTGNDFLDGQGGNDIIYASDGDDNVSGGTGNDFIIGGSGRGNDIYSGGTGFDSLSYTSADNSIFVDLAAGTANGVDIDTDTISGIENVIAGNGGDTLLGSGGDETLIGNVGSDSIDGRGGEDFLVGDKVINENSPHILVDEKTDTAFIDENLENPYNFSAGGDTLSGQGGEDVIVGDNVLVGAIPENDAEGEVSAGHDTIDGGDAADVLVGDNAITDDFAMDESLEGDGFIWINGGFDDISGSNGADYIIGDNEVAFIDNEDADDTFQLGIGGSHDTLSGGEGDNLIIGDNVVTGALDNVDVYSGQDDIFGDDGNDEIVGDNFVQGDGENDSSVWVEANYDTIWAGDGDNYVVAGSRIEGLNNFSADSSNDIVFSGSGADTIIGDNDIEDMNQSTAWGGNDTVSSGEGDDILIGDNRVADMDQDGTLFGGNDTLFGGEGSDTLVGDNVAAGVSDGDALFGNRDILQGGLGNDTIVGDQVATGDYVSSIFSNDDILYGDMAPVQFSGNNFITTLPPLGDGPSRILEATGQIQKSGDNASIGSAQNIDSEFALFDDADIEGSNVVPHVSVTGTGIDDLDFYEFTVSEAGSLGVFDIDYAMYAGGHFDPWIKIYDAEGNVLASNDDRDDNPGLDNLDAGSLDSWDSYIEYVFESAGTYYVSVGEYDDGEQAPINDGGTYELQVSVENHVVNRSGNDDIIIGDSDVSAFADDNFDGEGGAYAQAFANADTAYGGQGSDTIIGDNRVASTYDGDGGGYYYMNGAYASAFANRDELYGETGNDTIIGDNQVIVSATALDDSDDAYVQGYAEVFAHMDYIEAGDGEDTVIGDNDIRMTVSATAEYEAESDAFVYASAWDDTIYGGRDNDTIVGDSRATVTAISDSEIYDSNSEAYVDLDAGSDTIDGGDGDDVIIGDNLASAYAVATSADEKTDGDATISGSAGEDVIYGGEGNDTIVGDNKATVTAVSDSELEDSSPDGDVYLSADYDEIYGDAGNDRIVGDNLVAASVYSYSQSDNTDAESDMEIEASDDYIEGGEGDDVIIGDNEVAMNLVSENFDDKDYADADAEPYIYAGDDVIDGNEDNDIIIGDNNVSISAYSSSPTDAEAEVEAYISSGADTIDGGEGNDVIIGDNLVDIHSEAYSEINDTEHDIVIDGEGNGNDLLIGGNGADIIVGDSLASISDFTDGEPDEKYSENYLYIGAGDDEIIGGEGNDIIVGDNVLSISNEIYENFDEVEVESGRDIITAGDGDDTVYGDNILADEKSVFNAHDVLFNDGTLDEIEDSLLVDEKGNDDDISGGDGDDVLYGQGGSDIMRGGDDNDQLYGGNQSDWLVGGTDYGLVDAEGSEGSFELINFSSGDDLWGGAEFSSRSDGYKDVFVFRAGDGVDTIHDFEVGLDQLVISGYAQEELNVFQDGNDTIITFGESGGDALKLLNVDSSAFGSVENMQEVDGYGATLDAADIADLRNDLFSNQGGEGNAPTSAEAGIVLVAPMERIDDDDSGGVSPEI